MSTVASDGEVGGVSKEARADHRHDYKEPQKKFFVILSMISSGFLGNTSNFTITCDSGGP